MINRKEQKDTKELNDYPYDNQISPIKLKINNDIWDEFKKRISENVNLNHAIEYLIAKFIFIDNRKIKNYRIINKLYDRILKKEENAILLYGKELVNGGIEK